jgi:hypothetical protein
LAFAEFQLDYGVQGDSGNLAGGKKSFLFNVQKQHGNHN